MRRIAIAVMGTVSGLVLLFSYHTSQGRATTAGTLPTGTVPGAGSTGGGSGGTAATGSGSGTATLTDGTYTGDSTATQWGPVQVRITVSGGRVTAAEAVVYPNQNRHDQQINAYALPVLNQEAVAASSAQIDAVSGATVTSYGYIQSLQSAIDQARQG